MEKKKNVSTNVSPCCNKTKNFPDQYINIIIIFFSNPSTIYNKIRNKLILNNANIQNGRNQIWISSVVEEILLTKIVMEGIM